MFRKTYLDYNAGAPVHPTVAEAVTRAITRVGNPSSVHSFGRATRRMVEEAREEVAALVGADPALIVFTSGGTEANNQAIAAANGPVTVSSVEHVSVLSVAVNLRLFCFTVGKMFAPLRSLNCIILAIVLLYQNGLKFCVAVNVI